MQALIFQGDSDTLTLNKYMFFKRLSYLRKKFEGFEVMRFFFLYYICA